MLANPSLLPGEVAGGPAAGGDLGQGRLLGAAAVQRSWSKGQRGRKP